MEIKGIDEQCFRCKYKCEMILEKNTSEDVSINEFGEKVVTEITTSQKIVLDGQLQDVFDFIVTKFKLEEDMSWSSQDIQLKVTNVSYDRFKGKEVHYDVNLKIGWDIHKTIKVVSTETAYKILARALRETISITVWQEKIK